MIDDIQIVLRDVGQALISKRHSSFGKGHWKNTQFKSEADLMAEDLIVSSLRKLGSNLPVLTEEDISSYNINRSIRYWLIDPLDGTASYCEGFPGFVTQIALMDNHLPIMSAVYAPIADSMYVAELNSGAWLNGIRIQVGFSDRNINLIDNYPQPKGIAQFLFERIPHLNYLESGSIGLKICKVADGTANLFVKDVIVRDWDLAPGHLILSEAGGILRDLNGKQIDYAGRVEQTNGIIAASTETLVTKVRKTLAVEDNIV